MLIVLPGKPLPQKRHRHSQSRAGKVWVYDPQAREKHYIKESIRGGVFGAFPEYKPYEFPDLTFRFYMPIPKTMRKKTKEIAETDIMRHVHKPDVDNLIKLILDCMLKTVLDDDRTVKILSAVKLYSLHPRTEIEITPGLQLEKPLERVPYAFDDCVICDTPQYDSIEIPTFSECPLYSNFPQPLDK